MNLIFILNNAGSGCYEDSPDHQHELGVEQKVCVLYYITASYISSLVSYKIKKIGVWLRMSGISIRQSQLSHS